jgi:hypothetical protein
MYDAVDALVSSGVSCGYLAMRTSAHITGNVSSSSFFFFFSILLL